jgi:C-terminal processing protease CtpA/Prc
MQKRTLFSLLVSLSFFAACSVSKYDPDKKYSSQQLRQDYSLLRTILEKKHPSLYWYTSKDSMDHYFDSCYQNITDSMTEAEFAWKVVAPLTHQVRCGHTSFEIGKHKDIKRKPASYFPLQLKVWGDTMVVMTDLNKNDSVIKEGMLITSVNGLRNHELIQQMLGYLPLDGYSDNVNYIRISSNFSFYHRAIFGSFKNYTVNYIDSSGKEQTTSLTPFILDSNENKKNKSIASLSKKQLKKRKIENTRSLVIDSSINTGVLTLNTFAKGDGVKLRSFFRDSFKKLKKDSVRNCILDLRFNGGGDITMYVLLTKYLRNTPFKVADSAYAITKTLRPYSKYISESFWDNLGLFFLTKKEKDGNYHFWYWEKKLFKPKEKYHYSGNVYVLINGSTFSASTLFCNAVKGQSNITLVGEEAGGGWYGNNGIMIPEIVLPNTKLNVRLPLFRMIQYNHVIKDGRGVEPDIFIPPTIEGVQKKLDRKMLLVKRMIKNSMKDTTGNTYGRIVN